MRYDQFIERYKRQLFTLYLYSHFMGELRGLDAYYQLPELTDEEMDEFKHSFKDCMPLGSMMVDLWDWDLHFESALEDDWYFEAAFGGPDSAQACADTLADYFIESADEYGLDYNQDADYEAYESLVQGEASAFVKVWRENIVSRGKRMREAVNITD